MVEQVDVLYNVYVKGLRKVEEKFNGCPTSFTNHWSNISTPISHTREMQFKENLLEMVKNNFWG